MQLRSKRAKHQTAKQTHSSPCSLSHSLSHCLHFGSKEKKSLPFSHSILFLKYLTNFLSAFWDFFLLLNLSLSLENLQHLRINIILLLTSIVVSLSQSGWLNRFVFFQLVSYLQQFKFAFSVFSL